MKTIKPWTWAIIISAIINCDGYGSYLINDDTLESIDGLMSDNTNTLLLTLFIIILQLLTTSTYQSKYRPNDASQLVKVSKKIL